MFSKTYRFKEIDQEGATAKVDGVLTSISFARAWSRESSGMMVHRYHKKDHLLHALHPHRGEMELFLAYLRVDDDVLLHMTLRPPLSTYLLIDVPRFKLGTPWHDFYDEWKETVEGIERKLEEDLSPEVVGEFDPLRGMYLFDASVDDLATHIAETLEGLDMRAKVQNETLGEGEETTDAVIVDGQSRSHLRPLINVMKLGSTLSNLAENQRVGVQAHLVKQGEYTSCAFFIYPLMELFDGMEIFGLTQAVDESLADIEQCDNVWRSLFEAVDERFDWREELS